MALLHVILLALVQGITEFLPVSSSGHLVLVWEGLGAAGVEVPEKTMAEQLTLDVAVHVGTLLAVCLYFYRDIKEMVLGGVNLLRGRLDRGGRLALALLLATLPLAVVGLYFKDAITLILHDIEIVAWATIGFALVLYVADRAGMTLRRMEHMTFAGAFLIGLSQVLALIPGTSRSGITMSMARALGFERRDAARFSMLLSIPAIAGAGLLLGQDLLESGNARVGIDALLAAALSFLVALGAIALLIRWLERAGFTIFVIYRLILGVGLLLLIYI